MQRILAISALTLKAAFRFRVVAVLAVVLLGGVVLLPLIIKDDGTARGFTQILLTYTLMMITALLGFATLWLACGTLARDVEEAQMQVVAVKPVARWEIWLGKLLGIVALNAMLLLVSSGSVYLLMLYRARQLPAEQQEILRNEIFVARASARPPMPEIDAEVERLLRERLEQERRQETQVQAADLDFMRNQIRERLRAEYSLVPPGYQRGWPVQLGVTPEDLQGRPLFLRFRFNVAEPDPSGTYELAWLAGDPASSAPHRSEVYKLAANTFHEFEVPPSVVSPAGELQIMFQNLSGTAFLFAPEDGIEVLYREGGFALNYFRGVGILFCWLTLLAMIGLSTASFLSFPVAAFVSLGVLVMGLSGGSIAQILAQGTILKVNPNTGMADAPTVIDHVALPVFRFLLWLITLVRGFSPVDLLSTGRSVSWGQLAQAFAQICLVMGGLFALVGITTFSRRELATAQGTQ